MNIFRILSSGHLGFREEFVSAFLAYLLNPKMDHGLDAEVLKRLAIEVGTRTGCKPLVDLGNRLQPRFRSSLDDSGEDDVLVDLEIPYTVPGSTKGGRIDVVIKTRECFILIENKISAASATEDQITEQYSGFASQQRSVRTGAGSAPTDARPIVSLYLVPAEPAGERNLVAPESARHEVGKLVESIQEGDAASLLVWQPVDDPDAISMVTILRGLLADDATGRVSPLTYDVRQLIRAFIDFCEGDFLGFDYQRVSQSKATGKRRVADLLNSTEDSLYVGIQYGIAGLIDRAWRNPDFRNATVSVADRESGWQYLKLHDFKVVAEWAMNPGPETAASLANIQWQGMPFWIRKLYVVAKAVGDGIWIGIRGGLAALEGMSPKEIQERRNWQVSARQSGPGWFSGTEFCGVLEGKGISFDDAREPAGAQNAPTRETGAQPMSATTAE